MRDLDVIGFENPEVPVIQVQQADGEHVIPQEPEAIQ